MATKVSYSKLAEKALTVFATVFATSFAAIPGPIFGWKLATAAIAAGVTAVNAVLPAGSALSVLIDAVLAAVGHVVPAAAKKLAARKAAQ